MEAGVHSILSSAVLSGDDNSTLLWRYFFLERLIFLFEIFTPGWN
jgi:hypothetical protein